MVWGDVDYVELKHRLDQARGLDGKRKVIREIASMPGLDRDLKEDVQTLVDAWDGGASWSPDSVIEKIEIRAQVDGGAEPTEGQDPKKQAETIKKDPLYSDPGIEESSNWFSRAMQRLGEAIARLLDSFSRPEMEAPRTPNLEPGFLQGIGAILKLVVYGVLAALLGLFLYFVMRHFHWRSKLRRQAVAMLEDDEPERTVDEWLEQADALAAQGKYREAVRCLYLACLLKFDEAHVARFVRSQTNWEHLARIESSPRLPSGIEFRQATQEFDRIWYGYRVKGIEDVHRFRDWYAGLTRDLKQVAA